MKQGVFIERDGILTVPRMERNHQVSPLLFDDFKLVKTAAPLVQKLREAGLILIVTTNQPGLSRGYQSRRELDRMHHLLRAEFPIHDVLICPHDETDQCPCRKPKPGLLIEAGFKWHLHLDRSFVISDKWQDAEAARSAGCTSMLVQSPWIGKVHRDFLMPDLNSVVKKILQLVASPRILCT